VTAGAPWRPSLGAWPDPDGDGVRFRVWAPRADRVAVIAEGTPPLPLGREPDGQFAGLSRGLKPGARYRYALDGRGPFPDPASRFQPEGVHGPSAVVDPGAFAWTDAGWRGVPRRELALYELHVGTFSPEGTFAGAAARLGHLAAMGVNAVELMPLADFPGRWNWGYDGVFPFAPARCYGPPDDLRRLVDRAHALGLAVLLDVVYNHFGPDGNIVGEFAAEYASARHRTPWGPAVNLDGPGSEPVRAYVIENALHWLHEYHLDGLRLDATHALIDEGPRHVLAELAAAVRGRGPRGRPIHLIAEDHRNLAPLLRPEDAGGLGLDAVWSDDFHHVARRLLAGDTAGVFRDFAGTVPELVTVLNDGWLHRGAFSIHRGKPRGTDPAGLSSDQFVIFLQNHDRIGNRAFGERLHHQIDPAAFRAATALFLLAPQVPLIFMGQEWAAGTPFRFFADHRPELARLVAEGRRREFASYPEFADPATREQIPDPADPATFAASRLDWSEPLREPHTGTLRLHRACLDLRHREGRMHRAEALDADTLTLRNDTRSRLVVRLRGAGPVTLSGEAGHAGEVVFSTEEPAFVPDPQPPVIATAGADLILTFRRPGAVLLRSS
jgi:maltooligosyltrehalose trehalohydrolase